jgi:hypothetical protein
MTGARELFDTLTETGSDLCVELGTEPSIQYEDLVLYHFDWS